MLVKLLTISARDRFICPLRSPRGVSSLVAGFSDRVVTCMSVIFLWALDFTSVSCDYMGSKSFGGTTLIHPRELAPCLIFPVLVS